jgi:hypothetical protein
MNVTDPSQVLAMASVEFLHDNSLGGAPASAVIKQLRQHLGFVHNRFTRFTNIQIITTKL